MSQTAGKKIRTWSHSNILLVLNKKNIFFAHFWIPLHDESNQKQNTDSGYKHFYTPFYLTFFMMSPLFKIDLL